MTVIILQVFAIDTVEPYQQEAVKIHDHVSAFLKLWKGSFMNEKWN